MNLPQALRRCGRRLLDHQLRHADGAAGRITTRFIDENNYAEPSEKEANLKAPLRRPLQLFREVWKESAFRKLILFLVLTMGVRIVFQCNSWSCPNTTCAPV
ncbi:MAG: hypothetical protein ACLT8E_07275 [Akkermansia sp.]